MTFEAETFTALGTPRPAVPLPGELFDGTVNIPVMHQAVKAFRANQRQGNAATKIRKFVTGGNQKPWKQKGTGRARQGSTRAPHWVGGGTVFGPTPRSYAQYVPRQVRALARKSALNSRAREGAVKVIDAFHFDAPHTRRIVELVTALGVPDRKVLILTDGAQPNVYLSGRNLPLVQVLPYSDVSTYHILWSDVVLIEASAIGQTLEPVAETERAVPARKARAVAHGGSRAGGAKAGAGTGAAKAAKKAAKKTAKKAKPSAAKAKQAGSKSAGKRASAPAAKKRPAAKKAAPKKKRS
jgi:large subunit ribosomal protein L4